LGTAVIAAFVARAWFAPYLRTVDAAVLGLLTGLFAQVGDLVESLLKRDTRQGDSSDIIPGHGGILDRFDSLYFGAPLVYYYLKIVVFQVP
jgi:phosphatidate cytidylyltransferase